MTFEITSAACPNLPAGTTIKGQGTLTSVTWTTKRRGVTVITNSSLAPGTATDQAGNSHFLYSNQFTVSNTRKKPKVFTGGMIDLFNLDGPAALRNGFPRATARTSRATTGSGRSTRSAVPIDFATIPPHCDPL